MDADLDSGTARLLAAADAARGTGPEACAAVLDATLAAAAVSADAAAPYVTRLWFTPWQLDPGEHVRQRERTWLEPTSPVTVEVDGHRLAGFVAGAGPTVLLVHGWGDHAARLGAFIAPLLARGLRVLGVDLPGHGGSGDGQANPHAWSVAIAAVIAVEAVHGVVAHSLGGQALVPALRTPSGVRAAALIAPGVSLSHGVVNFASVFSLPPVAVTALRRELKQRFGETVWQDTADATARGLRLPALIVHSTDDDRVTASDVHLLASAWPGAQLMTVDGLGHARVLRDPLVVERTAAFIADTLLESGRSARPRPSPA